MHQLLKWTPMERLLSTNATIRNIVKQLFLVDLSLKLLGLLMDFVRNAFEYTKESERPYQTGDLLTI